MASSKEAGLIWKHAEARWSRPAGSCRCFVLPTKLAGFAHASTHMPLTVVVMAILLLLLVMLVHFGRSRTRPLQGRSGEAPWSPMPALSPTCRFW